MVVAGGSILFIGLMFLLLMRNPGVVAKLEIPWFHLQSNIFATICPETYGSEYDRVRNLLEFVRQMEAEKRLGRVNALKTRDMLYAATTKTRLTSKILAILLTLPVCILLVRTTLAARRRRFDGDEHIQFARSGGFESFVMIVSPYLDAKAIDTLRADPSPQVIKEAFAAARTRKNIPNNVVARLFPPTSWFNVETRLSLLEVGKSKERRFDREEHLVPTVQKASTEGDPS